MIDLAADRHIVAQPFVDGVGHHLISVDIGIARTDAVRHDCADVAVGEGTDDCGIGRAVINDAGEGLDDRPRLYFVVVAPHHTLFRADIQAAEEIKEGRLHVEISRQLRFVEGRRRPDGGNDHLRHPFMEKLHGEPGDGLPLIQAMIIAGSGEVAEISRFHIHLRGEGEECLQLLGRDRDGHALLRFGDKDLPRLQTGVFQRCAIEMELEAAGILCHLADGRGKAAGAVVGNRAVKAAVAGDDEEIEHAPLRDRIADLHRRDW